MKLRILGSKTLLVIETAVTVAFLYIAIRSGNTFNSSFWGVIGGVNIAIWIEVYFNYKREKQWKKEVISVIEMIKKNEEDDNEQ